MDWVVPLVLLLGILLAGMATGMPVAFTFLGVSIGGLYIILGQASLTLLAGGTFGSTAQFVFIAVPLFILMGEILMRAGIATITIDAADKWIGRVPARLSVSAVAGGAVFGSLSGSSMAAVAVFGSTLLPEMQRKGYKPRMSIASILAACGLDVLIPPSGLAVLLGALAKVSIAKLLIATIIPGLILAVLYVFYFVGWAMFRPSDAPPSTEPSATWRARLKTLWLLGPLGALIMVVTGFIFFGIATPSEAAAMGAIMAAILAAAWGQLTWALMRTALLSTAMTSSMVLLIIAGSTAYSQILAATGATSKFSEFVTMLEVSPYVLLIGMQLVMFVLGCFIDGLSIMLITLPVFMPVVNALGLDPIWVCVLFLIQLELGGITPPFGLMLFVLKGVRPELHTADIYRAVIPIVFIQLGLAGLLMVFPELVTYLPALMVDTPK